MRPRAPLLRTTGTPILRILLVEDDAMLADALVTALRQHDTVVEWPATPRRRG